MRKHLVCASKQLRTKLNANLGMFINHLHKLRVDLGREGGMGLELRADGRQIQLIKVRDKHDRVWVAHAHARHFPVFVIYLSPSETAAAASDKT